VAKRKSIPLKNCNNFVAAEYFFLKIYILVEEVSRHIPTKFHKKDLTEPKLWSVKKKVQIFN